MRLSTVVRVTRAPFIIATVVPVLIGAALAWNAGSFHLGYLLLSVVGIACVNAGLNMSNDYFDHLSGTDDVNKELTPFSGGSRVIQDGILSPRQVLLWSGFFLLVGTGIGLYLAVARGWAVLWIGLAGLFIAVFNGAPPLRLSYRGYGLAELVTFIGCGPLPVLGSYYVQIQRLTPAAFWASLPTGLLGAALIWINELPDYEADKFAGKRTMVVILGRQRGMWGYVALIIALYGVIVAGVAVGALPAPLLLALVAVPLAYKGIRGAIRYHSDTPQLVSASAATIQLYVAIGLTLCVGLVLDRVIG